MAHTPIDFAGLAAGLLDRAEFWVAQWLPDGQRRGSEYTCGSLIGGAGQSCSVNLRSGAWADFATGDKGGDLISLYAAIRGIGMGQAARDLMEQLGWQRQQPAAAAPPPPAPPAKRRSVWQPIVPVPESAPAPTFVHPHRGKPAVTWEYRLDGALYGHVCRFETSDGGKEILPHTWCVDTGDPRGTHAWTWKQWEAPRPLYVPATVLSDAGRLPVVLVEGEKCAMAGHQLLGHEFDFVSWPGGSKAWDKAAWSVLMGRTVFLWPDCDAKRFPLTKGEREAGVQAESKPLLPEHKQPGMAAMVGIAQRLVEEGCTLFLCPVPAPGKVADGWDVADAIAQGWTADQVRAFVRGAREYVPPQAGETAGGTDGASPPTDAGAGRGEGADAGTGEPPRPKTWRSFLLWGKSGPTPCRENVVLALDGMPERGITGARGADVVAFNEFTNDVVKLAEPPWGTRAGVWDEEDELELGQWLVHRHQLPPMARQTLEEAVVMVSKRHRYHPVRSYLEALPAWDGLKRTHHWLRRACLEEDEWDDREPLQQYLARVGTWFLMAMVARVMTPGCKFDYMLILEGAQGVGKSMAARILGGDWFADSGLVLGEKDAYQNLQGVWVYEISELDGFSRADVMKVKSFVSSPKDRFRASFDRRAKDYPRQLVFIGTTNEDHYLTDPTGNRRFWPVRVTRPVVDLEWLREHRDQLFAEALAYVRAGERFHPTHDEQRRLFDPQQQARTVESAIEAAITRYLYDENQPVRGDMENGSLVNEISLVTLLGRIGIGIEKLGPGRWHEKQAGAALRKLGWTLHRSSKAGRAWVYRRPEGRDGREPRGAAATDDQPRQDAGASTDGALDDCPF